MESWDEYRKRLAYDNNWRADAACSSLSPHDFYEGPPNRALAVCYSCPVRVPCLTFAVVSRQDFGIWGGATEEDRKRILRRARGRKRDPVLDLQGEIATFCGIKEENAS